MAKKQTGEASILRSAERLLTVLEWFSQEVPSGSVADIARGLSLSPSTVRRLLVVLEDRGYVRRDNGGNYRLGYAPFRLAMLARESEPLVRSAQDQLDLLQSTSGEAVYLAVRDGDQLVVIDVRQSTFMLAIHRSVGHRTSLHDGVAGSRVLLAWLPDRAVDDVLAPTWSDPAERAPANGTHITRADLASVREAGYAVDRGERIWSAAAPIRDNAREIVACLAVAAPTTRMDAERECVLIEATIEGADSVSSRLGYVPTGYPPHTRPLEERSA